MDYTPYKLKSWVDESKLNKNLISLNPKAIHYILNKLDDKIYNYGKLNGLSKNPNGSYILSKYVDQIEWEFLSNNPNAIHILEQYPKKIDWDEISKNHNAIHIIEKNLDKVNWDLLSNNPKAINIL